MAEKPCSCLTCSSGNDNIEQVKIIDNPALTGYVLGAQPNVAGFIYYESIPCKLKSTGQRTRKNKIFCRSGICSDRKNQGTSNPRSQVSLSREIFRDEGNQSIRMVVSSITEKELILTLKNPAVNYRLKIKLVAAIHSGKIVILCQTK